MPSELFNVNDLIICSVKLLRLLPQTLGVLSLMNVSVCVLSFVRKLIGKVYVYMFVYKLFING